MTGPQLVLGVKLRDDARFSNFYGERNAAVARLLRQHCQHLATVPVIVLCGDSDTGKSHLLQALCHRAESQAVPAVCISINELGPFGPDALTGLEQFNLVCLDDLDSVVGRTDWEEAIFHLYNRMLDAGHQLVVSVSDVPASLPFSLPDLSSRLSHGLTLQLRIYRDSDRQLILKARAEQRGLVMAEDVAGFILRRAPRRLGELLSILDSLDENSLQAQRRLTIPFVKTVMNW